MALLRVELYRQMQIIRQCEEQLARSHQRGLVHGACHTYLGQEAVAVGVCAHLRREDVVFSTHRGHGHALAKGVTPLQLIAELYGRSDGCSRGRGGSMHLFSPEVGLLGTSGIVGPSILQAAGGGYTFKLLKTGGVAVAFFGDGAVNNGAFHEGLNLAGIWRLPVLFVCEINSQVEEAHRFAEQSPWPEPASAATHVYAKTDRSVPPPPPAGQRELSYAQATLEALTAEMAQNPRIFVLGEGIGKRGGNFKT